MEKKNLKKWVIEKETISNLSKFQEGKVLGGYDDSFNGSCGTQCFTWCINECVFKPTDFCTMDCTKDCCGTETCNCPAGLYSVK